MKIGIIGSGFGLYGLLPAFKSVEGCEVSCICGKKTKRLTDYCKSIGLKNIYSNWEEMLKNEDLDAIAIAVMPSAQYDIAKLAMSKGLNIFAEKPLTISYKQSKELFDIAIKNKIITTLDFIFPEINEWQEVKHLIDSKKYGKLKHISVSWDFLSYDIKNSISSWKSDIKEGGGALSFYFSHSLYYLEYYAGEILKINSSLYYSNNNQNGGETGVDLVLKFKNGVSGIAHICCDVVGMNRHQLIFSCEKATLVLENNKDVTKNFTVKVYTQDKEERLIIKKDKSIKGEDERVVVVKKLASRFVYGCANGIQVIPSFAHGARVQKLMDDIRKQSN